MQEYLIISRTGRSLAESAKRAGYRVHVVDAFADMETRRAAVSVRKIDYSSDNGFVESDVISAVQDCLSKNATAVVVLGSGFEHCPEIVQKIANFAPVYANSIKTVREIKHPQKLYSILQRYGINTPEIFFSKPVILENILCKRMAGTGGEHIQWSVNIHEKKKKGEYFQRYIDGAVFSVVFLADGKHSIVIGYNKQRQERQIHSMPFLYMGCVRVPNSVVESHRFEISRIIDCLVRHTGLKGLCGIDYIVKKNGDIYVLEVNPRPPASFELHEDSGSLFGAHVACFQGNLEKNILESCYGFKGYVILYLDFDLYISPSFSWPFWVKDRPATEKIIKRNLPVCTVHADGNSWFDINRKIKLREKKIRAKLAKKIM